MMIFTYFTFFSCKISISKQDKLLFSCSRPIQHSMKSLLTVYVKRNQNFVEVHKLVIFLSKVRVSLRRTICGFKAQIIASWPVILQVEDDRDLFCEISYLKALQIPFPRITYFWDMDAFLSLFFVTNFGWIYVFLFSVRLFTDVSRYSLFFRRDS